MSVSLRDCLIANGWRDEPAAKRMKHDDCRNTVIVDLNKRDGKKTISYLHVRTDAQLMDQALRDLELSTGFR
jgi:hypothetical protein